MKKFLVSGKRNNTKLQKLLIKNNNLGTTKNNGGHTKNTTRNKKIPQVDAQERATIYIVGR